MSKPLDSSNSWDTVGIPDVLIDAPRTRANVQAALNKAAALYGNPIYGTTRATFALPCGTKVLKIPYTEGGIYQNEREAQHHEKPQKYYEDVPLAACSLTEDENGVPLLEMERVTPLMRYDSRMPSWAYDVDSEQVGITTDGRIVAYDL